MNLVAIMPVRNEDWILGLSARALLRWVDSLVILDHASTDTTRQIIWDVSMEHPGRVVCLAESGTEWREMAHRQQLLDAARDLKATHIAIVDADEVLSGDLLPTIRAYIERTPANAVFQLPWMCLRGSIDRVHHGGTWGNADVSCAFRDDPRWHWSSESRGGYDFHHRHPMGRPFAPHAPLSNSRAPWAPRPITSGLMHLQFVSDRRLRAKQALYQVTERLRWPGRDTTDVVRRRYSPAVYGTENPPVGPPKFDLAAAPASWWVPYVDLMQHFHPDAAPWQEAELKRLLDEHPGIESGLDLFGVDNVREGVIA